MGGELSFLFRPEQTKDDPGLEVIAVLKREPQAELQALLDALEPVDDCPCLASGCYTEAKTTDGRPYRRDF